MTEDWCVAVFKCKADDIRKILVDFYKFVKDMKGVRSLHFLIRDRLGDKVVFSFRVLVDLEDKSIAKSKMVHKLGIDRIFPILKADTLSVVSAVLNAGFCSK
jgi:hypothetical protein